MKHSIYILFSILLLVSCNSKNKDLMDDKHTDTKKSDSVYREHIELHSNGKIKIQGNLVNNKREGHWETFFPDGTKQSESTYQKGILFGKTASYYHNGLARYVGYYENNLKNGTWYFYLEDGTFEKEVLYKNDTIVE